MRKTGLTDSLLLEAVNEMAAGLIDADLGGGVVKKRIALPGRGKRGGVRTLVATKELEALQDLASTLLPLTASQLEAAIPDGTLLEISP